MKVSILLLMTIFMCGCVAFPDEGRGGWAENFHQGNEAGSAWYSQSQGLLLHDLDHLSLRLEIMRARGIRQCMPAQLKLATLMHNRIRRQLAGQMFAQSQHDLRVFYHQINLLQNHFDDINQRTHCANFTLSHHLLDDAKASALALLNSDNQFAFADEQVTPKYADRLKQAVELLKFFDSIELLLVGHTDAIGSETDNLQLGLQRAKNVAALLKQQGLSNANIAVVSQGESAPYSADSSVAGRLSNRRVVAYILAIAGEHQASVKGGQQQAGLPLLYWTESLHQQGSQLK